MSISRRVSSLSILLASCVNGPGALSVSPDATVAVDSGSQRDGGALDSGQGGRDGGATATVDTGTQLLDTGIPLSSCPTGAIFCEDFEAVELGAGIGEGWTSFTNGSVVVDGTHAQGARALHVHTDQNGYGFMRIPSPPQSFFLRLRVWVDAFPSSPANAHYTLVEAMPQGGGTRVRALGGQSYPADGGPFWGIGSDGGASGDWTDWYAPREVAHAGRWVCAEMELRDADDFVRLTIDGVPNENLTVTGGSMHAGFAFPTFDSLNIGWQLYQTPSDPGAYDVWIDDLVLDDAPIGCD
jgi:hypothetical protein